MLLSLSCSKPPTVDSSVETAPRNRKTVFQRKYLIKEYKENRKDLLNTTNFSSLFLSLFSCNNKFSYANTIINCTICINIPSKFNPNAAKWATISANCSIYNINSTSTSSTEKKKSNTINKRRRRAKASTHSQ